MMPEMRGFEVCNELQKNPRTSKIPIIVVTAKGDFESIEKAYKCGSVKNYVAKPFERSTLLTTITEVLETGKTRAEKKAASKTIHEGVYREIIDGYPEAIVLLDNENTILDVNNTFEAITGFSKDEEVGSRDLPGFLKPQDDNGNMLLVSEAFRACFCDDPISTATFNIINKNGMKLKVITTVFKTKSKMTVV